jgi:hypothetical protein
VVDAKACLNSLSLKALDFRAWATQASNLAENLAHEVLTSSKLELEERLCREEVILERLGVVGRIIDVADMVSRDSQKLIFEKDAIRATSNYLKSVHIFRIHL